ncbi:DUF2004 domain-containing protein [Chitinophaga varians]|uniref:DUF2004 domain-containing protein n=1 Tax=Chitinophaga varians TaxID=2202339 RepID=A0A847RQS6_9BACT|nr:DUF2004 domain-containing protein [Chitinophaga varians]NLR63075.1 DUF2004 domain-containing protein [Chitinophaga varians]
MQYSLPYFGEINLAQLEEYYQATTASGVKLDLNFEHTSVDVRMADLIKSWLQDIEQLDNQNILAIQHDFATGEGETRDYIRFYIEELENEEVAGIIGDAGSDEEKSTALLHKLRLKRVGFYPDGKYGTADFAIFDYTIDINGKPCDQLLVLKWKEPRQLAEITWES